MSAGASDGAWELKGILERVYARAESRGWHLTWHEKLTSVLRPLYAPFPKLLHWIPQQARILDIGCGSGAFLFLANEAKQLGPSVGIDANAKSIALARVVCDSDGLSFRTGIEVPAEFVKAATVVALIDVLHHVPAVQRTAFLQSILSEAPAGARILVKDLDPKPGWKAVANRVTDRLSTGSRVSYMARRETENVLTQAGFTILTSERLDALVWNHYLVVGEKRPTDQPV